MKTSRMLLPLIAASAWWTGGLLAQTADNATVNNARNTAVASARDGFTRGGTDTLITRDGVTEKVLREVVMPNGMRVLPDGTVFLPNGDKKVLRNNQILTMRGVIEETALLPNGTAPVTSGSTVSNTQPEVGLTALDGITVTGANTFLTRNGARHQITSDVQLEGGIRVQPNGVVTLSNGTRITLKPDQLLKFDGSVQAIPPARR